MSPMELPEEETPESRPPDALEPGFPGAPDAPLGASEGSVEPLELGEPGAYLPPMGGHPADELDSTVDALLSMAPEHAEPAREAQVPSWAQADTPTPNAQPEFAPIEPHAGHLPSEPPLDSLAQEPAVSELASDSHDAGSDPVAPSWTDGSAPVDTDGQASEPAGDVDMFDVPLGTLVYRSGLLTAEQIEAALEQSEQLGKRLGEVLVDSGMIAERDLGRLLAGQKGLPFLDLAATEIDPEASALLPSASARIYCAIPIRVQDGELVVAVSDPTNGLVVEGVRRALGGDPAFAVATRSELERRIAATYGLEEEPALDGVDPAGSEPLVLHSPGPEPAAPQPDPGSAPHPPASQSPGEDDSLEAAPLPPPEPLTIAAPSPDPEPEPIHEPPPAAEVAPPATNLGPASDAPAPFAPPSPDAGDPDADVLSDLVQSIRIVVRLAGGEAIDAGEYADPTEAGVRARELVALIDRAEPGQWPFFAGRFTRPDTILTVDLIDEHPRY